MKKILTFRVIKRDPVTHRVTEELGEARGRKLLRSLLQKHGSDIVEGLVGDIAYWQVPPPFDVYVTNMENFDDDDPLLDREACT